jgi:uncharacterized protein (TIGR02757 family)
METQAKTPDTACSDAASSLGDYLEGVFRRYHRREHLEPDPLAFLHRYSRPADVEVAGLIAAVFAYGRVDRILVSAERVLAFLGDEPARRVRRFDPARDAGAFEGFVHRWSRGADVVALLAIVRRVLEHEGSLEALFLRGYEAGAPGSMRAALSRFSRALRARAPRGASAAAARRARGLGFLLPDPFAGSACKRLNLYLRWMVRDDALDRGVWRGVSTADLVMPLDTHVARISRNLGLSRRKSADWKMAEEVTAALRGFAPDDPTRYDFALCRLGILEACPTRQDVRKCLVCELRPACRLYRELRSASPTTRRGRARAKASRTRARDASP